MIEGGCNCGDVRYRIEGDPLAVAVCHCTQRRRQSGSAYSVNLVVAASAMTLDGPLSAYDDPETSSGAPVRREFCGRCGSPIRSIPAAPPNIVVVKAGTADVPEGLVPTIHLWTRSKLPWVEIPAGMVTFERNIETAASRSRDER